ncbi:FtsK/SpoIIIE domain-containing protein [Methylobacterium sp. NPDC014790]|uniref:FtsK/SpoIIIE domain-containing protein n=1 Tax=Methylobacterium sp. NPDC014790 TaxID=3364153 RepID=UPI003C2FF594
MSPTFAPFAARWDAEADRRRQLRTPENLKKLMEAQKNHTSARATAAQARNQLTAARKASKNPFAGDRRAARTADKAARQHRTQAKGALKVARKSYPTTLNRLAVQAHALHAVPAAVATYAMSTPADWAVWPSATSAGLVVLNAAALLLGRRTVTVEVEDGLSAEERALCERLDPSYWVQHADARGLSGTVTTPPAITSAGIECEIRLDGKWTVKALRAAADNVRAVLGAKTELPMLIAPGSRGGWAVLRLRTRSAAPDGVIVWRPGDAWGVDMVTGEDVHVPLGHRMLIAGMSGSGKSTASRPLLYAASAGPENVLVIIDLKMVEGRLWDHRARVAYTPEQVVALVQELVDELTDRLKVLPKGQATLVPTAARPRITVVVDEGAEVMSSCQKVEVVTGYTEKGKPVTENLNALEGLDSIARMGRAACIDLWWMTQSPTYGDGVPRQIAKQLGWRIGLNVESPTEARVVFGESAQDKGWKADELPMPGVAMLRNGKRTPDPIKVRYIDDQAVIALPNETIWRRGAAPAEVPAPAAAPVIPPMPTEPPAPAWDPGAWLDDWSEVEEYVEEAAPAVRLRLVKDGDFTLAPPAPVPASRPAETAAPATNRDRVLAAVVDGARTGREITDRTGINKGTVSKLVKALVEDGELVRDADGVITVAPTQAGEVSA